MAKVNHDVTKEQLLADLIQYHVERNLGHLGSCLSCLDILHTLFYRHLNSRDFFVLSKGHAVSLVYLLLNKMGHLSDSLLGQSCKNGAPLGLGAHPPFHSEFQHNWLSFGSGSLGYGLGLGAGLALAKKNRHEPTRVFVLISEGDLNAGSSFESLQFIARQKLSNLVVCLDYNQYQALSCSQSLFNLKAFKAFLTELGFFIWEGDGHTQVDQAFASLDGKLPSFLIFNTLKNRYLEEAFSPLEAHYLVPKGLTL